MNRYDNYKDSGVTWVEKIPSHWKKCRNKDIFSESKIYVGEKSTDYTLLSLTKQGVIIRDLSENKGKFPKEFDSYKVVENGDMVFCLFDVDETPRTVGLSKYNGMITGAYDIFKLKRVSPDFVLYYYLAIDDKKGLRPLYKGLRKVVPLPSFMSSKIYLPPLSEQISIASYLKDKTSKIEQYVAQRERERELLESLKQSEIANVVTKGLNPDAPMKNSGIPWIGLIPEHWTLRRVKNIFIESKEKSVSEDVLPLSLSKESGIIPASEKQNRTMESASFIGYKVVKKGDVVFNRFKARLFSVSTYDGVVSPDYAVYKCRSTANAEYIVKLFGTEMYREAFNRKASGIGDGFSRLYTDDLFAFYAIFPPLSEQQAIVAYIENKLQKIDTCIADLQAEIDYLKEFKQRLISDVVTGQICVTEQQKGELP